MRSWKSARRRDRWQRRYGSNGGASLCNRLCSRIILMSQQIHKPLLRFFVLEGSEEGRCLEVGHER
jgi:hypothetical protein